MKAITLRFYKEQMLRVLVHIQQGLDESLTLEELARVAHLSPYHFHRIFHGMIGESLQSHIRRLRLERAAARLKVGQASVIEIALEAGYETHEAFGRAFKTAFGTAPSRYRRRKRTDQPLPAQCGVHFGARDGLKDFRTRRSGGASMNVMIKRLEPRRVAFLRHVGPYAEVGAAWDRLLTLLGKEGLIGSGTLFIGLCHDDPDVTAPDKVRYDACVTVDRSFAPAGEIGVQTIPGGEYAVTTHIGPYTKLGECYTRLLGQWLPRGGRELRSSPCFEVYLNSPENTEPEDLITDIYAPLAPERNRASGLRLHRKVPLP